MIYLLGPSEITELAINEYFACEVLHEGSFDDLLRGGRNVVVYDCTCKEFVREVAELLLKGGKTKVLVVLNGGELGVDQTDNLKIYNYKSPIEENASEFKKYLVHKVAWLLNPAEDFDHIAYLKDKPNLLLSYYNTQWARENNISDKQRAYHHYLLRVSKAENNFKEKNRSKKKADRDLMGPSAEAPKKKGDKECVCLKMTCKEVDDYKNLVQKLVASADLEASKQFDFVVAINNDAVSLDTEILMTGNVSLKLIQKTREIL